MDRDLLARADEIVASLSAGKREMVREIVINAVRRHHVDASAQRYLTIVSGGPELAAILAIAIESARTEDSIDHQGAAGSLESPHPPN